MNKFKLYHVQYTEAFDNKAIPDSVYIAAKDYSSVILFIQQNYPSWTVRGISEIGNLFDVADGVINEC